MLDCKLWEFGVDDCADVVIYVSMGLLLGCLFCDVDAVCISCASCVPRDRLA